MQIRLFRIARMREVFLNALITPRITVYRKSVLFQFLDTDIPEFNRRAVAQETDMSFLIE